MINVSNIKFHGLYADDRVGGGVDTSQRWRVDRSGYREGKVIGPDGAPVGGILVGCIHIPTRKLFAHTISDSSGKYRIDGLTPENDDYLCIAYPDKSKLGSDQEFATRWMADA